MGVKAGYDAAKERGKEEIELLKFLLPANSGNIEKDLIFLALHRGYKQQKAARALSRETIALVKEAAAQKRGKAYEEKVWRDLCGAKELNEWPLRPYGDSLNTLTGNMARVAGYIKILKAEMDAYPQITETSFEQKIKNMLNKGGEWIEDITKGIGAIITEWRGIKKEEDKKIEQRGGRINQNSLMEISAENIQNIRYGFYKFNNIDDSPNDILKNLKSSGKIDVRWTEFAREAAGYFENTVMLHEGAERKIYIIPKNFEQLISIDGELKNNPNAMNQLRCFVLHANFLAGQQKFNNTVITGGPRTPLRQAELVFYWVAIWILRDNLPKCLKKPIKRMYSGMDGDKAEEILTLDKSQLLAELKKENCPNDSTGTFSQYIYRTYAKDIKIMGGKILKNSEGYNHVVGKFPTIDLGISNETNNSQSFRDTLALFRTAKIWLNHTTLLQGEGLEPRAHHVVFIKGL